MEKLLKIPYAVFNDWNLLQQFLERKGNPKYELVGDVNLFNRKDIFDLGNLVRVDGCLDLSESSIETLGNLEYVGGYLDLNKTKIQSLGNLVRVDGYLDLSESSIETLGNLEYVGGHLILHATSIESLGNLKYVGNRIHLLADSKIPERQLSKFDIKYGWKTF